MNKTLIETALRIIIKPLKIIAKINKDSKDILGSISSKLDNKKVEVINKDTNVLLEVAKNTRGLKERLDKVAEKTSITPSLTLPTSFTIDTKLKNIEVSSMPAVEVKKLPKLEIDKDMFPKFPTEMKISDKELSGKVSQNSSEIKDMKKTVSTDLKSLAQGIKTLQNTLELSIKGIKIPEVNIPKFPEVKIPKFPTQISFKEASEFVNAIQGVRDDLASIYKQNEDRGTMPVEVTNFNETQVATASPTSMRINALRGETRTTALTITTTRKQLPETPIENRKTVTIYNNSDNTVYFGGADVTALNGVPVAPYTYSPSIDAHNTMGVYAIAETNSEVRVLEASSEREGTA